MRDVELFQMALGLESPWYVERTEFDAEGRRLDLYLNFRKGGRFQCPECGAGGCPAHDTTEKSWRHLNFFQHEAYLHARIPRPIFNSWKDPRPRKPLCHNKSSSECAIL